MALHLHARQKVGNNPEWEFAGRVVEGLGPQSSLCRGFFGLLSWHQEPFLGEQRSFPNRRAFSKTAFRSSTHLTTGGQDSPVSVLNFVDNNSSTYVVPTYGFCARLSQDASHVH